MSDPNIAEKYYGKLKAQGEDTIADFIWQQAETIKQFEAQVGRLLAIGGMLADEYRAEIDAKYTDQDLVYPSMQRAFDRDLSVWHEYEAVKLEAKQKSLAAIQSDAVSNFVKCLYRDYGFEPQDLEEVTAIYTCQLHQQAKG